MARLPRSGLAAAHDLTMAALSVPIALFLRWGADFIVHSHAYLIVTWPAFVGLFAVVALTMRLHRSLWRHVSMGELSSIVKAVALTVLVYYGVWFGMTRLENIPRSVPFIHFMVLVALLAGPRALYRILHDAAADRGRAGAAAIPVLLIGARDHAEQFLRALQRMPDAPYRVTGMVDDTTQTGRTLHGVTIYGTLEELPAVIVKLERKGERPQRLLLSEDYIETGTVTRLLDLADQLAIPLARLPRLTDFQEWTGTIPIRPVQIEDLLGRAQNVHDRDGMQGLIRGKVVLVTGAGGSIGSELCRQIARHGPALLLLYDHSEYLLYEIDRELGGKFPALQRQALLGDVRDAAHLRQLCLSYRPGLVLHAAAIKHVPLAESNPLEAIRTNVFGTGNVAKAAAEAGAADFVLISTDKAVNPTNIMGAAKRLAERLCREAAQGSKTRVTIVRFGNVLGSRGSVVPLFQQQLEAGGPITITHPDIERYFMTIREAVELVLQAATLHAREAQADARVYVLDMGKPVKIVELARQMIRLAGLKPEEDIAITYTGLRPGEKMYEELFYGAEELAKTAHASIMLATQADAPVNGFAGQLERLKAACEALDAAEALTALKALVPEYQGAARIAAA